MADPLSEERFLELLVSDPGWCLFAQRERVKQMLPALTKAYILVTAIQKELIAHKHDWGSWIASPEIYAGATYRVCQECSSIEFLERS